MMPICQRPISIATKTSSLRWLEPLGEGARLRVWLQPRAAKTEIIGVYGDALKVKITSPPVEGRANQQLLRLFSKRLGVPVADIVLSSGRTSRHKTLDITGLSVEEIPALLKV